MCKFDGHLGKYYFFHIIELGKVCNLDVIVENNRYKSCPPSVIKIADEMFNSRLLNCVCFLITFAIVFVKNHFRIPMVPYYILTTFSAK